MHKGASNAPPVPIKLIKPNEICIKSSNSECVPAWFRIRIGAQRGEGCGGNGVPCPIVGVLNLHFTTAPN